MELDLAKQHGIDFLLQHEQLLRVADQIMVFARSWHISSHFGKSSANLSFLLKQYTVPPSKEVATKGQAVFINNEIMKYPLAFDCYTLNGQLSLGIEFLNFQKGQLIDFNCRILTIGRGA